MTLGNVQNMTLGDDRNITLALWWNTGAIACGLTMGIVHFYSPIYRVRFSSDPQTEHLASINVRTSLRTVLVAALVGWLTLGGLCSRLLFGALCSALSLVCVTPHHFSWVSVLLSTQIFHVLVVSAEAFVFLKAVEVVIQLLVTGKNLRVTHQGDQPMAVLLGGLCDASGFSQEAAVYELFELVLFEENRRRQVLFKEIVDDSLVVKEILLHLIDQVRELTRTCRGDLEAMREIERSLTTRSIPNRTDPASTILQLAPQMARWSVGRSLLVLWINGFRRVRHLPNYQPVECIVASIGALAAASFEEDVHGQVQLLLPAILKTLVDFNAVLRGINGPIKALPQCPPSDIVHSVQQTCRGAVLSIVGAFSLPGLQSSAIRLDRDLLADIEGIVQ